MSTISELRGTANKTWRELVTDVATVYKTEVTDEQADTILWNFTGFPAFFYGDPVKCATRQLHEFFAGGLNMRRRSRLCRSCDKCECPQSKSPLPSRPPLVPHPVSTLNPQVESKEQGE